MVATGLYLPPNPPLNRLRSITQLARLSGMASLLVWDHFQEFYPRTLWTRDFTWFDEPASPHEVFDYQTLLGALAVRAGRLQLGVGVTEPIRRHPVQIAQAALTLAHLTTRPPILGLGSGERMNTQPYGLPFTRRVDRLEEALQIMRRCISADGPIDFEGNHFRLHGAIMDLTAPPGCSPQIWLAAHGPRMLALTGRYADGWLPMLPATPTPQEYGAKLSRIRQAAQEAGRDPDDITPALMAPTVLAPTEKRARALMRSRIVRYWGLLFPAERWREAGLKHPLGADFGGFVDVVSEDYEPATLEAALSAVPPHLLHNGLLIGTPAQIANRLRQFADAGLRHVVLGPISAYVSRTDFAYTPAALYRIAQLLSA
ncbi:LLM class flavin-dependent oxidoreductase [Mycobacterium sp. Marseille-P9652]|uniref:LLM class flavin-dependent oxidoreductase n=1 Tax=Mycobacterium sp. Marseille-P9652 TaxID=2654950 RepID=UPI0012E847D2|nr:LLM class flavin-dependent oxidoreductase [Mycobacterium sp. Marseille-P9652]